MHTASRDQLCPDSCDPPPPPHPPPPLSHLWPPPAAAAAAAAAAYCRLEGLIRAQGKGQANEARLEL